MQPPRWMQVHETDASSGQITLQLGIDVLHEDFLPDMCDYLRDRGARALIPLLRAAYRQIVARHNTKEAQR